MGLLFDGADGLVETPSTVALGTPITLFAWIKPASVGETSLGTIFQHGPDATYRSKLGLMTGDKLRFASRWVTTAGIWEAPGITLGAWQSVAASYNHGATANDPKLYVNGLPQSVTETATPAGAAPGDTQILRAGNSVARDHTFDGALAELAVWSKLLTDDELLAVHLLGPLVIPTSLAVYWTLGSAIARDYSGNGRHGTISGGALEADDPPIPARYRGAIFVGEAGVVKPTVLSLSGLFQTPTVRVASIALVDAVDGALAVVEPAFAAQGADDPLTPSSVELGAFVAGEGTPVAVEQG